MREINQVIKASQIDSENKQQRHLNSSKKWSSRTEKLVLGLFARFADLFGDLARVRGLEIKNERNEYTRTFELWCAKLADLNDNQIANGVTNLERRIEQTVKDGEKVWPPSYSEFRGLCLLSQAEKRIYRTWAGLPAPQMTQEERKERMKALRGEVRL